MGIGDVLLEPTVFPAFVAATVAVTLAVVELIDYVLWRARRRWFARELARARALPHVVPLAPRGASLDAAYRELYDRSAAVSRVPSVPGRNAGDLDPDSPLNTTSLIVNVRAEQVH